MTGDPLKLGDDWICLSVTGKDPRSMEQHASSVAACFGVLWPIFLNFAVEGSSVDKEIGLLARSGTGDIRVVPVEPG